MPERPAQYSGRHTASEVEILRQRVRTLEEALRPFARSSRLLEADHGDKHSSYLVGGLITIGDLRAAAEAMGEAP